uniref:Uncharacterized protein n=1 Tax=Spermophilus dauricus TaxID=99837 RepID=A0A8C9QK51_SPEDA
MADGKAREEKPEKPKQVGATGVMEGKVPVTRSSLLERAPSKTMEMYIQLLVLNMI